MANVLYMQGVFYLKYILHLFLHLLIILVKRGKSVYIRQGYPCVRKFCYECSWHEVVCLRIRAKHTNFYVLAVYRNPGADDSLLDCLLTAMSEVQQTDRKSSFVFFGDFNAHDREWQGSVSQTDAHGRVFLDFATSSSCQQLVAGPTHSAGNPLDLVLTDVPGVVSVVISPSVGRSDHAFCCYLWMWINRCWT